ncbi:hypothetical protein [Streptomyces sp. NPDC051636]|uniref:hypothetical protein n=1 Tax=Streptomyces sp. NPDC051636 TaxID=3365663 RepID=UPI003787FBEA
MNQTGATVPAAPGWYLIAGLACAALGALSFLGFLITATCKAVRHHRTRRNTVRPTRRYQHAATTGALLLAAASIVAGLRHLYLPAALFGLGVLVLTEAALREHRRRRRQAVEQALAVMTEAARARRVADEEFEAGLPQRMDAIADDVTQHLHAQGLPTEIRLGWDRDSLQRRPR